jgi:uncharacterized pyridoxamine 5'-phosphate oxidase family protein
MSVSDCIKFANTNPISFLATLDGDQPHVRGMQIWFADQTGVYYSTAASKDLYKHMKTNPKVEVCFFDTKSKGLDQMRITGQVEFLDDIETKEKLLEARPFLKQMGFGADNPNLIVFRVVKCRAHFWNWATNLQPKQYITFG